MMRSAHLGPAAPGRAARPARAHRHPRHRLPAGRSPASPSSRACESGRRVAGQRRRSRGRRSSLSARRSPTPTGNPLPQYFQSRPSARRRHGYDPTATGASNLGPESVVDTLDDPRTKDDEGKPEPADPGLQPQPRGRQARRRRRRRPYCTAFGVGAVLGGLPPRGLTGAITRVVSINEECPATPFLADLPAACAVECAGSARTTRGGQVSDPGQRPSDAGRPAGRGHRQRQRPRPATSPGLRAAAGDPSRGTGSPRRGGGAGQRAHARAGASASSVSPRVNVLELTWPWTGLPRTTAGRGADSERREDDAMTARGSCGSTWAPHPASARPTRCSTRGVAGRSAAPTWWSASSRPTAARTPQPCSRAWRSCRGATLDHRGATLHRDGPGRRARAAPRGRARRRARPHQRARLAQQRSAGRTSRSCSTPAST